MFDDFELSDLRLMFAALAALAMRANVHRTIWSQEQRDTMREAVDRVKVLEDEKEYTPAEVEARNKVDADRLYDLQIGLINAIDAKSRH